MRTASAILLSFLLSGLSSAMACVGCREPGTSLHEPQTLLAGTAFSWNVIGLLGFVLTLAGGISFYIFQTCRRLERANSAQQ